MSSVLKFRPFLSMWKLNFRSILCMIDPRDGVGSRTRKESSGHNPILQNILGIGLQMQDIFISKPLHIHKSSDAVQAINPFSISQSPLNANIPFHIIINTKLCTEQDSTIGRRSEYNCTPVGIRVLVYDKSLFP